MAPLAMPKRQASLALGVALCWQGASGQGLRQGLRGAAALGDEEFCADKLQAGLVAAPADWPGNVDCRGYFNCWNGNEPMQLCGTGTVFDPALKQCAWADAVSWTCGGDDGVSTTERTTTTPADVGTTTTAAPVDTTTMVPGDGECVSQRVLTCINEKSNYWPKCDPNQAKDTPEPDGYEFGYYCTQEWAEALNAMLSDPVVGKCRDREATQKFLAQVAYETGYYSTLYQPRDGGAGLIHMIPQNWPVNAGDMDALWPGSDYVGKAASMGKSFFQSPTFGWRSVAAWYKRTNGVIGGCGLDLFDQPFEIQTKCILGQINDRSQAYEHVGECLASA